MYIYIYMLKGEQPSAYKSSYMFGCFFSYILNALIDILLIFNEVYELNACARICAKKKTLFCIKGRVTRARVHRKRFLYFIYTLLYIVGLFSHAQLTRTAYTFIPSSKVYILYNYKQSSPKNILKIISSTKITMWH